MLSRKGSLNLIFKKLVKSNSSNIYPVSLLCALKGLNSSASQSINPSIFRRELSESKFHIARANYRLIGADYI